MSEVPHIPDGIVAVQRTGNPGHLQTHAAQKILRCRRAGAPVKCNGLAQRHLSTIADSRTATSHGTRVRLTEEEHGRSASSLALFGVRALVVEDAWQIADALKLSLEKMGMVVVGPAATTAEARRMAAESNPDLAIVDVNLNGEMAYALMDWLHDRGARVIVISGYEDLPLSLGKFAATLHKPFTAIALLATLQRVMERDRAP